MNCTAWFPLVQQGGPWFSAMNDQWFWIFGLQPHKSKEYVLLSWLDITTWEFTASKMMFNFLNQMLRSPRGTFLAELFVELRRDCRINNKAWLFGALRILSKGLSFQRSACLLERVDNMLDRLKKEPSASLLKVFSDNLSQYLYRNARERLAAIPDGPHKKLRILKNWVTQDSGPPTRFRLGSLPCFCHTLYRIFVVWFFSC